MALPMSGKVLLGILCVVIVVIGELYAYTLHFETRAVVYRGHFVVLVQVFLYLISKFLWRNLTDFDPAVIVSGAGAATESGSSSRIIPQGHKKWTPWKSILLVYLLLAHTSYVTNLFLIGKEPHWFAMLAYCCLGFYFQMTTAMVLLKCVKAAIVCLSWRRGRDTRFDIFSKRLTAILSVLYAICATFWGLTSAAQLPKIKHVTIPVMDLPLAWENMHIVQLSDVHLGPTVGHAKLDAIVDLVNKQDPDLVVLTGDLVDGSVKLLGEAVTPLGRIKSRHGKFFVSGNHEYYTGDVDNWFAKLKMDVGFTVLHNANVKLHPKDGTPDDVICLAGADDIDANLLRYEGHGFDIDQAMLSCDPRNPVIFLAHQPKAAKLVLDSEYRVDLVLSGHTHGGQFFPMIIAAYIINPFYAGLYKYRQHSHVYVSMGTQYWGIPMRLGTTMEITDIMLVAA